ncbi:MAG: CvpA family protein [Betaproteobacteria bacterium]|nr:CvpA family protein [Betaproteobacteria bacterium]
MSFSGFTGFDWVVVTVVLLSSLLGLWRGLVSEVLALLAWVAAFFAARTWGGLAAEFLSAWLRDPGVRQVAGFAAVFVLTLLLFAALRFLLAGFLRMIGLGLADRFLGMLFGAARGLLMVLAGVLLGGLTELPRHDWWREAMLALPLETAVVAAKPWLPAQVAQRIRYR